MHLKLTIIPWKRIPLFQGLLLLGFGFQPSAAVSQDSALTATVDVAKTYATISKNIYCRFLEHG